MKKTKEVEFWEAISERAKTEDIKVLAWDDGDEEKTRGYLSAYDADRLLPFAIFMDGRTRWTAKLDRCGEPYAVPHQHAQIIK